MTLMAGFKASHFLWRVEDAVAVIQFNRPERKNPLTFNSYAELRDTFRKLPYANDIHAVVILPNGGNFCSGGDVHEIIGPLVAMDMKELLAFTRMTGDFVKAMLHCGSRSLRRSTAFSGRWCHYRDGFRYALATPQAKSHFCSIALASPAATWAHAGYCLASSARAAPRSCCFSAGP